MENIGEYLRKERERQNLSIEEVARLTKIKDCFISAIEEGRFDALPSPFYVKSFLRLYARILGLHPEEVLTRLQGDPRDLVVPPPDVPLFFVPRKRIRRSSTFVVLFLGIFLAGAVGYGVTSIFQRRVPSFAFLRPAATSSPVQVWTAQEETADFASPQAPQEETVQEEEAPSQGMSLGDAPSTTILEAAFGKRVDVVQGRPKLGGIASEFASNERVYFFTRIQTPLDGKITHVWLWEGKEVQAVEMDVQAPAWAVYSYVTLRPQQTGKWRVDVREGSRVLSSRTFEVVESDLLT